MDDADRVLTREEYILVQRKGAALLKVIEGATDPDVGEASLFQYRISMNSVRESFVEAQDDHELAQAVSSLEARAWMADFAATRAVSEQHMRDWLALQG